MAQATAASGDAGSARHGDGVVIRAEGEDEEAAVDALVAVLAREEEE